MPRYKRGYSGERRTRPVKFHLTASELTTLAEGAARVNLSPGQYARTLCTRRSAAQQIVAGTRRAPDMAAAIFELTQQGKNLNQLTKRCNTDKEAPQLAELTAVTASIKAAIHHLLQL